MKLKGDWDSGTAYAVGDVVRYTNGEFYVLQSACEAGVTPIDTHWWGPVDQVTGQAASFAMDAIDSAKAAAEADVEAELAMIAPEYTKTTYSKGEICKHEGKLYLAKQNIGTAENWTASHWEEITVGDLLAALNAAAATIPTNINDEAITLSTATADYLITVDDSGEAPELDVTAITEEAET